MLTVYRSNRADLLAQLLGEHLLQTPPDPFETVSVVVNTWPTSRWLGEQLALKLGGIAANIRFPFPGSHLRALVQHLLEEEGEGSDPWRATDLVWPVLELLPQLVEVPEAAPLRRWLECRDEGGELDAPSGNWHGRSPMPSTTSACTGPPWLRPGGRAALGTASEILCLRHCAGSPFWSSCCVIDCSGSPSG